MSAELDVTADGRVTTTGDLEPGIYRIMALAESEADYTGTATLALLLTVGWRLEYVSAAAGGTVRAKIFGSQLTVLSGAAIGPGRLIEFTAEPLESHFVEDWTGACAGLGRDGRNDNPGQSQTCVLKMNSDSSVTAVFAEADSSALVLFNGTGVQTVGQAVEVVHRGLNFGYVLSLQMVYHGIQRNFHVMRLSTWASNNRYLLRPPGDGRLVGPTNASGLADYGFAVKTCNRNGWRVPTVGEIIGLSHSGDASWSAAFAGGRGNLRAHTAAGALRGLEIPVLTVSAGADGNPVPAGFYELDSRDASGYYAAVRYHKAPGEAAGEVHFPWSVETGRWIMCVRDAGGAAESPELAAVLLESGGRRIGDPVDRGDGTHTERRREHLPFKGDAAAVFHRDGDFASRREARGRVVYGDGLFVEAQGRAGDSEEGAPAGDGAGGGRIRRGYCGRGRGFGDGDSDFGRRAASARGCRTDDIAFAGVACSGDFGDDCGGGGCAGDGGLCAAGGCGGAGDAVGGFAGRDGGGFRRRVGLWGDFACDGDAGAGLLCAFVERGVRWGGDWLGGRNGGGADVRCAQCRLVDGDFARWGFVWAGRVPGELAVRHKSVLHGYASSGGGFGGAGSMRVRRGTHQQRQRADLR